MPTPTGNTQWLPDELNEKYLLDQPQVAQVIIKHAKHTALQAEKRCESNQKSAVLPQSRATGQTMNSSVRVHQSTASAAKAAATKERLNSRKCWRLLIEAFYSRRETISLSL